MEEINCKFCKEKYNKTDRIPKILLCGHTYCNMCINDKKLNLNGKLKCLEENIEFQYTENEIKNIPTNISLLKLLDTLDNEKKQEKDICTVHNKKLEIICINDNILICSNCALFGDHKNHNILYYQDILKKLSNRVSEITKNKDRFETKNEYLNNNWKNQLKDILNTKSNILLNDINEAYSSWLNNLNIQKGNLINDLKNKINLIEKFIDESNFHNIDNSSNIIKIANFLDNIKNFESIKNIKVFLNKFNDSKIIKNLSINLNKEIEKFEKISQSDLKNKLDKIKLISNDKLINNDIFSFAQLIEENVLDDKNLIKKKRYKNIKAMKTENLLEFNIDEDKSLSKFDDEDDNKSNKSFLSHYKKRKILKSARGNINHNVKKSHNNVSDLISLTKNNDISVLNNNFVDSEIKKLGMLGNEDKSSLKLNSTLDLSSSDIFDKNLIEKLNVLKNNKYIKSINLYNNKITDFGFKNLLKKIESYKNIESIDLSNNLITNFSLSCIEKHFDCIKNLKNIKLYNNKIKIKNEKLVGLINKIKSKNINIEF